MKNKTPISFILFVVIPVVIAAFYYSFFASGQYVVETKYVIEGQKPITSEVLGVLAGNTSSSRDSYIAQEYIWSASLLNKIDKELGIKEHYSDDRYDRWARLSDDISFTDFLDYWKEKVEIDYDGTSGITTITVTAFTAEKAFAIANKLLLEAEIHVNKLTERLRKDKLDFAKNELKEAEQRLIDSRAVIIEFRNTQKDIDPERTTLAKLGIVAELESQLAIAEADLADMSSYLKSDSIKLRTLKSKVASLKRQARIERKRWGNNNNKTSTLNNRLAEYEKLLAKKAIAEKFYESSLASLEGVRVATMQQKQYLEIITSPYKPSEAEKPYIFSNMLSVILGSLLFWIIGSLIISAVKDHA